MTLKPVDPHLTLQAWLSPAYPVSGFAYSHGVEQAVARGDVSNLDEARAWVHMVLTQGSGRNDALLITAAWRGEDVAELARARAVAQERLIEMEEMGQAFVRTTNAAYGLQLEPAPYAVAFAQAATALEIPLPLALRAYLNAFVSQLVGALVRLVPLGQTMGQVLVAELADDIAQVAQDAEASGLEALGSACFASDMVAMEHSDLSPRLFRT